MTQTEVPLALRRPQLLDGIQLSLQQVRSSCWRADWTFHVADHIRQAPSEEDGKKAAAFEAAFSVMSGLGQVRTRVRRWRVAWTILRSDPPWHIRRIS